MDVVTGLGKFLTSSVSWSDFFSRVLVTAVLIVLTFTLSRFARLRFRAGLERSGLQLSVAVLLARLLWIAVWVLGVMTILYVFGVGLTPLAAFIGVVGLAASLALQQVLQNLVAGVYLLAERPFHIGDLIAVVGPSGANHEGTVEDIQMRTTHLRNRRGELILMPNSAIFSGVVTNRTAVGGYVSRITVTFPRSSSPDGVRDKLVSLLRAQSGVMREPAPEVRIDTVGKEDWTGSVVYWVSRSDAETTAVWAIASAFPEASVGSEVGGS